MINEVLSDSQRLDKNQKPAQNMFMLSDKFLATERAACASLETRLRNLAEKAASRSTFHVKEKQFQWCSDGSIPSSTLTKDGQIMGSAAKNGTSHCLKTSSSQHSGEFQSADSSKPACAGFTDISSLLCAGDENEPRVINGAGNSKTASNVVKRVDSAPKSEAEKMGIFLRSPKKSDTLKDTNKQKSQFSLEEEDIERVLGLIESLEARNSFLSKNLVSRDAEFKDARTRLEELEDVLTLAKVENSVQSVGSLHTAAKIRLDSEELKARESELKAAYRRMSELQRDSEAIILQKHVSSHKVIIMMFSSNEDVVLKLIKLSSSRTQPVGMFFVGT